MPDSVRIETIIRTERIPDTVFIEVPDEREQLTVRDTASHLETSFAVSNAQINPAGVTPLARNKAPESTCFNRNEVNYRDSIIYRDRTNTEIVEVERELTWWQQTKMRGFWVLGKPGCHDVCRLFSANIEKGEQMIRKIHLICILTE